MDQQQAKKKFYKRWWFWVLVFIVIIIIAAAGSGPQKSQEVGSNQNSQTPSSSNNQAVYKVGDQVKLGDAILTVNQVELSSGGQFAKPAAGNQWINLNITIENDGTSQKYITTLGQMFLMDKDNNSYQVTPTDRVLENPSASLDGSIVAKTKRTGWVGFEIKKGQTGLKFQYNGSMFGGGSIVIDLGR